MTEQPATASPVDSPRESVTVPKGLLETVEFARRNPDMFEALSKQLLDEVTSESLLRISGAYASLLLGLYDEFVRETAFVPGSLVKWKPGLKNKRRPAYKEPAVVVELLADPVVGSEDEPGSSYFREPLDLKIGVLNDEKELVIYHVDSHRFMDYAESERE